MHYHTTTLSPQPSVSLSFQSSPQDLLQAFKEKLSKAFFIDLELQITQFVNDDGIWWYAFNPKTGLGIYADTEADLQMWIEDNS